MKEAKEMISLLLKNLMNLNYNYTMDNVREILNGIGFTENLKLKVFSTKKKILDKLQRDGVMDDRMAEYDYLIDPCKNISLFIKLLNGLYFTFVFIKGVRGEPIFRTNIDLDYIYVYTSKIHIPSIYFYGEDVISKEEVKLIDSYYKNQKSNLTNLILKYNKLNSSENLKFGFSPDLNIQTSNNSKNEFFEKEKMTYKMINVAKKIALRFVIWKRKMDALDSVK